MEISPVAFQACADIAQVDQVAVVRDGDEALGGVDANRLRIQQCRISCRRVAGVADGHGAGKLGKYVVGENLRHQAHALDVREMLPICGRDAGRLLAAMLQGVKAEISLACSVMVAVNGDHAAFFVELVAFGDSGQWTVVSGQLPSGILDADDSLAEELYHAVTSPWRVASKAEDQGARREASDAEIMGCR